MESSKVLYLLSSDEEIRSRSVQYAVQLLTGRGAYFPTCCSGPSSDGVEKAPFEESHSESIVALQDDVLTLATSFSEFIKSGKVL